jgi:hypothetical protein
MKNTYKVVCIDNKPGPLSDKVQSLTIGKIYETNDLLYRDIFVINDQGNNVSFRYIQLVPQTDTGNYSAKRFIYLEECRDSKINEILNG